MAILTRAVAMLVMALFLPASAFAEKRVALVIGNSVYKNDRTLANPARDAKAVAEALRQAGFAEVTEGYNLTKSQFDDALKRFGDAASNADWAMVFFAGHGIAVGGETYLLPVDAALARAEHVDYEAVPLARVRAAASAAKALRMVILDSCRNNPFAARMSAAGSQKRAVNPRGLSRPAEPEGGELIAYATRENDVADDGDGEHSPFTGAFLDEITKPGVEVNLLFRRVRSAVLRTTNKTQDPAIYQSLPEDSFYFRPPLATPAPGKPEVQPQMSEAAAAWIAVQNTTSEAVLEEFVRCFGDSVYAGFAKARLDELRKTQLALNVPKPVVAPQKLAEAACDGLLVSAALSGEKPCIKPGSAQSFKDCADCPEMVAVPAGSFMMGSPETELRREFWKKGTESPQHKVHLQTPFAVGKFSVTFDEWDACVSAGSCNMYRPSDEGWGRGRQPVINVSWDDAQGYVDWISRKTGKNYRLLSEAEREYVARADTETTFWWGSTISTRQANYDGRLYSFSGEPKSERRDRTLPVNTFAPNPWGLYNVHGNVWEWVDDCWVENYTNAPPNGHLSRKDGDCKIHVIRGGAWSYIVFNLRAAARYRFPTATRGKDIGFRVARTF